MHTLVAKAGKKSGYHNEESHGWLFPIFLHLNIRTPDSYDAKIVKNLQTLDMLACKSANKPPFQNVTKSLLDVLLWFQIKIGHVGEFQILGAQFQPCCSP